MLASPFLQNELANQVLVQIFISLASKGDALKLVFFAQVCILKSNMIIRTPFWTLLWLL